MLLSKRKSIQFYSVGVTHVMSIIFNVFQACMVEGDDEDDLEKGGEETITFLYKFCSGVCPKSYGFNAARLAEIPKSVIQNGRRAARVMEGRSDALVAFKKLFADDKSAQIKRDTIKTLAPILKAIAV